MTLDSSQADFAPPDPVSLLCLSGLPTSVAENVVDILRRGHCLREVRADYPPVPPGSLVVYELRLTQYLPDAGARLDTPGLYGLCVTDGSEITTVLGLLDIARDDVLDQRRKWKAPDA